MVGIPKRGNSKSHFLRMLRSATGMSPYRFLQDVRVDDGRAVLRIRRPALGPDGLRCLRGEVLPAPLRGADSAVAIEAGELMGARKGRGGEDGASPLSAELPPSR